MNRPGGKVTARLDLHQALCWLGCGLVLCLAGPVSAQTLNRLSGAAEDSLRSISISKRPLSKSVQAAHAVFEAISEAWSAEDHAALAKLIAPDGVRIAIVLQPERDSLYSPSQAFYFFKSLFQSDLTDVFRFRRWQNEAASGRMHAVADWQYRRAGSDSVVAERLFFTLTDGRAGWGLSEIRTIR